MIIFIWIILLSISLYLSSSIVNSVIIKKSIIIKSDITKLWILYISSILIYLIIAVFTIGKIVAKTKKINMKIILNSLIPFNSNSKKIVAIVSIIGVLIILPLNIIVPPELSSIVLEGDQEGNYHKMSLISFFKSISLSIFVIWLFIVLFLFTHAKTK
jgi:hypothetical protein